MNVKLPSDAIVQQHEALEVLREGKIRVRKGNALGRVIEGRCVVRIGLSMFALVLLACGARVEDNHTGGKTSWLSACTLDEDCDALPGAVCASALCTKPCQTDCDIAGAECAVLTSGDVSDQRSLQVCLPSCAQEDTCATLGSDYECTNDFCILAESSLNVSSTDRDATVPKPVPGSTQDADAGLNSSSNAGDESNDHIDAGQTSPRDCAETIDNPGVRPYLLQIENLGLEFVEGEPACEGACGYHYWAGKWTFSSTLVCPLLETTVCDELRQEVASYVPVCNTPDDCTSYTGDLSGGCSASFVGLEYWTTELYTPAQSAALTQLALEFGSGGCGTPRAATGVTYMPVACIDGLCDFESVGQCE